MEDSYTTLTCFLTLVVLVTLTNSRNCEVLKATIPFEVEKITVVDILKLLNIIPTPTLNSNRRCNLYLTCHNTAHRM